MVQRSKRRYTASEAADMQRPHLRMVAATRER